MASLDRLSPERRAVLELLLRQDQTYEGIAGLLDLPPERVMLVAAHPNDLRGARAAGLRTALVPRPEEWGHDAPAEEAPPAAEFDYLAPDFLDLARQLGA